MAENLTYDVVYSSEIEGIRLNMDQVRSSIARRLGIDNVKYSEKGDLPLSNLLSKYCSYMVISNRE
jgi:hypothetical protein